MDIVYIETMQVVLAAVILLVGLAFALYLRRQFH